MYEKNEKKTTESVVITQQSIQNATVLPDGQLIGISRSQIEHREFLDTAIRLFEACQGKQASDMIEVRDAGMLVDPANAPHSVLFQRILYGTPSDPVGGGFTLTDDKSPPAGLFCLALSASLPIERVTSLVTTFLANNHSTPSNVVQAHAAFIAESLQEEASLIQMLIPGFPAEDMFQMDGLSVAFAILLVSVDRAAR